MNRSAAGSWSFSVGRWRGVEFRLHLHFPLLAIIVVWLAQLSANYIPRDLTEPHNFTVRNALLGLGVLFVSVVVHEAVRALVARRVGGRTNLIVLGPTGGWSQPHLPSDPPAHLVTAISGPLSYLAFIVTAAYVYQFRRRQFNDLFDILAQFFGSGLLGPAKSTALSPKPER